VDIVVRHHTFPFVNGASCGLDDAFARGRSDRDNR
jgi:hypothetical protein